MYVWMDIKKNMDDYPQCYSAEMSNIGGMYIKKGIFSFYLKISAFKYYFYSHNIEIV